MYGALTDDDVDLMAQLVRLGEMTVTALSRPTDCGNTWMVGRSTTPSIKQHRLGHYGRGVPICRAYHLYGIWDVLLLCMSGGVAVPCCGQREEESDPLLVETWGGHPWLL